MRLHLVHTALVHVPIAFLVVGGGIEAAALATRRPGGVRFGGALVLLGALALVPTIVAGIVAANVLSIPPEAHDSLEAHERSAWILLAAAGLLVIGKAWYRGTVPERLRVPYALALSATVALAIWTAWLGADLVYGYGVGVGVG